MDLQIYKPKIELILPEKAGVERVLAAAQEICRINPKLMECTPESIIGAVVQSILLDFPISQELGFCYFVPYNTNRGTRDKPDWVKECQFQIGYKGFAALALRSDRISHFYGHGVYSKDRFSFEYGLNKDLKHKPAMQVGDSLTAVYVVVCLQNGQKDFIVLDRNEVEGLRRRNKMQGEAPTGAWLTDPEQMWIAKAMKRMRRFLPLTIEAQKAWNTDEKVIRLEHFKPGGELKVEELEEQFAEQVEESEKEKVETLIRAIGQAESREMLNTIWSLNSEFMQVPAIAAAMRKAAAKYPKPQATAK